MALITNLTNEDLQYGFDFPKALSLFRKWCGKEYSFLTWGQDDEEILRENLALYSIEPVWLPKFYDAQKIFGFQTGKPNRQFSLLNALKYFHEDALDAHDALHDAMNTVRVCHHLDLNAAFSYYDEMIKSTASSDRTVPRYSSRGEALESEQITSFLCRTCSKMVKCGEWVKKRHEVRMALADCPDCSRYYVQVRFRRDGDECFRATRRIQILTDELMNQYQKTRQERIAAEEAFLKE